jgi:hypothetical protein
MRIKTDILTSIGLKTKKLKVEGNFVIVRKEKKGKTSGYKAEFDKECLLPYRSTFFRLLKNKLMLVDGAEKCISFRIGKDKADIDIPVWDRQTEEKLFQASVVKTSGQVSGKLEIPVMLYIVMMVGVLFSVLTLLAVSGRLKI